MAVQPLRKIEQLSEHRKKVVRTADTLPSFRLASLGAPQVLQDTRRPLRLFIGSDAVALVASYILAWFVTMAFNSYVLENNFPSLVSVEQSAHAMNFFVTGFGLMLWLAHRGHYRSRMPFWTEIQQVVTGAGFCILLSSFVLLTTRQDPSRLLLVGSWVFAGILICLFRAIVRRRLQRNKLWQVRTLVIGGGTTADDAKAAISSEPRLGYRIVGQIADFTEHLEDAQGSWTRLCNWYGADFVLIALDGEQMQEAEDFIANLTREKVPFAVCPPLRGVPVLGMEPQYFFNHDVMLLTRCNRLESFLPRITKRAFDIIVSGSALLALAPAFAVIGLMIKRDGGSAFYSDRRIGVDGRVFGCLKFRSMIVNSRKVLEDHLASTPAAAAEWAETQKLKNDPRVTKIGAFIRKTSVDELPQLINVFKGDMSLVGPRPVNMPEIARYGRDATFYQSVRPGITGLWQVSGRNDVSYERRVQLDRWYVRNWSLWHDIAILFKTVPVLLLRKGAY
ncbi:MAG: undecaprenyl-phosphate galactose phosphotransferase WbaP [Alphaproteobacteria bacterium]|nr:undecaprenyl-phosphate galactose phosphotransferase WbaP [Alphaproteobacteria bacterium]